MKDVRALSDYVNPFTTWLHGVFFLHAGTDASDSERARVFAFPRCENVSEKFGHSRRFETRGMHRPRGNAADLRCFRKRNCADDRRNPHGYDAADSVGTRLLCARSREHRAPETRAFFRTQILGIFPVVSGAYAVGDAAPESVPALSVEGVPARKRLRRKDFFRFYSAA